MTSSLILDGLPRVRFRFGLGGEPVPGEKLADEGVELLRTAARDGSIAAILTNDRQSVGLVLAAVMCGYRLISLPLPPQRGNLDFYIAGLRRVATAYPTGLVARPDVAKLLERSGVTAYPHDRTDTGSRHVPRGSPDGFALTQHTSGTTGAPKAVTVASSALEANISAILDRTRPEPGDTTVSWLPLAHDMGLVGMLLTSVSAASPRWVNGGEVVLLTPEEFLRTPGIWAEAIARHGGTFTAAPDFAFRLAVSRGASSPNLSSLRCAIIGGETVRESTLSALVERFGPSGLDPRSLCPAYGMAEIGLAASLTPPDHGYRKWTAAPNSDDVPTGLRDVYGDAPGTFISSGPPLAGYNISTDRGPGTFGEIVMAGPSVVSPTDGRTKSDGSGRFRTGDLGFEIDGWWYVCGRIDDYVTVHGRQVHCPDVEVHLGQVSGVRSGRAAIVGLREGGWAVAVELTAGARGSGALREVAAVATRYMGARPSEVVELGRGELPRTSSGKLRRVELTRLVQAALMRSESLAKESPRSHHKKGADNAHRS